MSGGERESADGRGRVIESGSMQLFTRRETVRNETTLGLFGDAGFILTLLFLSSSFLALGGSTVDELQLSWV